MFNIEKYPEQRKQISNYTFFEEICNQKPIFDVSIIYKIIANNCGLLKIFLYF